MLPYIRKSSNSDHGQLSQCIQIRMFICVFYKNVIMPKPQLYPLVSQVKNANDYSGSPMKKKSSCNVPLPFTSLFLFQAITLGLFSVILSIEWTEMNWKAVKHRSYKNQPLRPKSTSIQMPSRRQASRRLQLILFE